jgi:hypothetical protein
MDAGAWHRAKGAVLSQSSELCCVSTYSTRFTAEELWLPSTQYC